MSKTTTSKNLSLTFIIVSLPPHADSASKPASFSISASVSRSSELSSTICTLPIISYHFLLFVQVRKRQLYSKRTPFPTSLSTSISPPCTSTYLLHKATPKSTLRDFVVKRGSKILPLLSSDMPSPVSAYSFLYPLPLYSPLFLSLTSLLRALLILHLFVIMSAHAAIVKAI